MSKTRKIIYTIVAVCFILILNILLIQFESANPEASITNLWDSIWYMFVSLTTVGYGDMYPTTVGGKLIGYIFIFASLGLLGYLIGQLTTKIAEVMEKRKLGQYGTEEKNHVVLIGWNEFGSQVATQIIKADKYVAVVTNNKNDIELIRDLFGDKVFALFADFDNYEALQKVNIDETSTVFINFDDDTKALVYLLNFKKHYKNINLIVSLNNSNLKETFSSAGVTYAISKDEIASKLVASYIFEPDVADITEELMATSISKDEYDIMEYKVSENNPFNGMNCEDAFFKIKKDYNGILLAISKYRDGKYELTKNPDNGIKIAVNDYIVIMAIGDKKKIFEKDFSVREGRLL
ncbi:MAG: potassium channel protein [Melioribacteraceae bacterium]|nr:potassium channel protein [Melioribacteraceae bacterium]